MKTIEENHLVSIVGGDSFWEDLGEFIGGFICGFGVVPDAPGVPLSGAITAGIVSATIK